MSLTKVDSVKHIDFHLADTNSSINKDGTVSIQKLHGVTNRFFYWTG